MWYYLGLLHSMTHILQTMTNCLLLSVCLLVVNCTIYCTWLELHLPSSNTSPKMKTTSGFRSHRDVWNALSICHSLWKIDTIVLIKNAELAVNMSGTNQNIPNYELLISLWLVYVFCLMCRWLCSTLNKTTTAVTLPLYQKHCTTMAHLFTSVSK